MDACNGDLLLDDVLCEVKAGTSKFRGRDLRQVLTYVALNFAAEGFPITSICLVNPRTGVWFREDLDRLSMQLAGASSNEVLSEIIRYVSESTWRDESV